MKKLWRWVADNSLALQGAAAIVVVLSAAVVVPTLAWRAFKPEVILRVDPDRTTVPPDLVEWIRDVSLELRSAQFPKGTKEPWDKLRELISSPTGQRVRKSYGRADTFSRLRLEVHNQSDRVISGVRLRVDRIYSLWDTSAKGTFLTEQEIHRFLSQIPPLQEASSLILPELPGLPPRSSLQIVIYGDVENAEAAISVQGATSKVERIVKVEDAWLIDWYQHPYKAFPVFFLFSLFALLSPLVWGGIRKQIIRQATPGIIYNAACREAREGQADRAILLLQEALEMGFSDKAYARNDSDLVSLRDREDFKKLVGE